MRCPKCKSDYSFFDNFCSKCGQDLTEVKQAGQAAAREGRDRIARGVARETSVLSLAAIDAFGNPIEVERDFDWGEQVFYLRAEDPIEFTPDSCWDE